MVPRGIHTKRSQLVLHLWARVAAGAIRVPGVGTVHGRPCRGWSLGSACDLHQLGGSQRRDGHFQAGAGHLHEEVMVHHWHAVG